MTQEQGATLTEPPVKERLFSKDFILIMIATTSTSFMNYIFGASVALHIAVIGGLQVHTGLLTMVYSITSLIMRPTAGILADKLGRVKLLIVGAAICAICCFLYGSTGVISILIVIRGFKGLGFGMHSTCAGAVAGDVLPKSRMSEGLGIYGVGSTVAQALAPMIALAIIGDGSIENFRLLFYFAAGLCVLGTVTDCCITYERKRKKMAPVKATGGSHEVSGDAEEDSEPLPKALFGFEYAVFAPVIVMVLLYMSVAALILFLTPYARGFGVANPGLYYLVTASGILISRLFFGRISDRRGNDIVIIPGLIVFLVLLAALAFARSLPVLLLIAFPIGLAQGAVMPTFNSLIFRRCSAARRGTASGAAFASIDIGFAIGAPLFGVLADARGYDFIFLSSGVLTALAVLIYFLIASDKAYNRRQRKRGL